MSLSADEASARRAGAVLTIDLGAIAANWRGLRDAGRAAGRGRVIACAGLIAALLAGLGSAAGV
ncbi:MAG: hypothetical protein IKE60_19625, partial [Reyranella sp.]|nr:hypothetical protein [Reyranella sp.]